MLPESQAEGLLVESRDWPSWDLTDRQMCDLELLLNGGFAPLRGFLGARDHASVLERMRLADGRLWPMPVMLNLPQATAEALQPGQRLALRDQEGRLLAALKVADMWPVAWRPEAQAVFGTEDPAHPGVDMLRQMEGQCYVGGELLGIESPRHYDFAALRFSPAQLQQEFRRLGWERIVAFQTRNPMHRAHQELTLRAATQAGANLLLHPVVGMTKPGDVDYFTRVRCYQAIAEHYPHGMVKLSLLNLAMRMGGPREALWHALIRRNHGCTHLIVGRDHAGPGKDSRGVPFYPPYAAQELVTRHEQEIGIACLPFQEMVYVKAKARYLPVNEVAPQEEVMSISGTELRRRLRTGEPIPDWFTFENVAQVLRAAYPERERQGVTLFFTGLSGAGKSTIANILVTRLLERGGRTVTLLDGDHVRKQFSAGLGFSKADRDENILRIGFVANEITRHGGIVICAPIAPYADARRRVRETISANGAFVEIYLATPVEVCAQRDRKGLYVKARAGLIRHFTGVDDPYEPPEHPEIRLDTLAQSAEQCAQQVLDFLRQEGLLA